MKNYYLLIVLISAIVSCNTKKTEKKSDNKDSTAASANADTASIKKDSHYFWSSEFDSKGLLMTRVRPLPDDSLTAANILQLMNELYPEIIVKFDKLSNDTLFVNIRNSNYLTQQTGSSGPEVYFAELTYNLTELKNINYVNIKFKKGDHASPGTFTRTDFAKRR
jgi:hypothetical protein